MSTALDGNAIAGDLARGLWRRAHRSKVRLRGVRHGIVPREAVVYMRGPGRVARCRACGEVHMVLVTIRGITCVDMRGMSLHPQV